ncbi:MAG TPA: histidine--tRNA ligase [Acidimicrobiia bacterium]|nr:histidine--tRNA ligase [Acidimicrobiia bacterium]
MPDRDVYRAPKGMLDVLPPASARWIDVVTSFATLAQRYGFGLVLTPIVEHYEVFQRVGESTDVVTKEMYEFTDRGGRHLALRPEGTAGVVRAFVQHRPPVPWKVWYVAPHFRAEAPQAGRYRQHWQVGVEVLGVDDAGVDVEVIALADAFYRDVGLKDVHLRVNSMGDSQTLRRYSNALREYWRSHASAIGNEIDRAETNPMRVLDWKRPDLAEVIEHAPQFDEFRSDESWAQWTQLQEGLQAIGLPYEVAPRLVRGFDYYRGTVFEFASSSLEAAQNGVGGGGRYDLLAEQMGGPPTPGIGFGIGIERVLLALDSEGAVPVAPGIDVFVVDMVGGTESLRVLQELRALGLSADRAYGGRSVKKQWSAADKAGARYGVMLGARELAEGNVAIKHLGSGEQIDVHRDEVAAWLKTRIDQNRNLLS